MKDKAKVLVLKAINVNVVVYSRCKQNLKCATPDIKTFFLGNLKNLYFSKN